VLAAYVDASEEQPSIPVAAVAGFVANTSTWEKFEDLWKEFLREYEIKGRFHAANYWAREGQFRNWGDAKHLAAKGTICRIFNECGLLGVGCAVSCKAFDEWRLNQRTFVSSDPYYFCLDRVLRPLIIGVSEHPRDEGIAIYVDHDRGRERVGKEVAKWHESRLRRLPKIGSINPEREVSTNYVSSFECLPIQAADILSNSAYKFLAHYLKTGEQIEPPFTDGLDKQRCLLALKFLHDPELIEIDMRGTYLANHSA